RARLRGTPRRAADEEDVALSAFKSLCRRAKRGQFSRLAGRGDLWQLLFLLTVRKAISLARHERRQSRGGGRVVNLSEFAAIDAVSTPGPDISPALAIEMADECRRLMDDLGDETLRSVALWKMEGHTNAEIATRLGCIEQTVERKVRRIRQIWV